jgi:alcohol dehydrogenase
MFLAEVMAFNVPACTARYARIAGALGVEEAGRPARDVADDGVAAVRELVARCGIPRFRDLAITADDLPVIASKVLEDQFSLTLNPVPIGPVEVEEILWNSYARQ